MTATGIEVERDTKGSQRRLVSRELRSSVAAGEIVGIQGANDVGKSAVAESASTPRRHDGGRLQVRGLDPAEQRTPVRHLVLFPARVV
jgi:ABC-type multidrug transport system ATPase subunit